MRSPLRYLLLFLFPVLLAGRALAQESAAELIEKGNVHYEKFQPGEALKYYLPAEKLTPKDAALLVRIARQYRHMASDAGSQAEKVRLGNLAISYSRRAVALAPSNAEAHLALAISVGKMQPHLGKKEKVAASREVKAAASKVVSLDPRNDLGWHTLGRLNMLLADVSPVRRALAKTLYGELPPGSNEEAVRCFEKAIALNPSRPMHYIELGRVYAAMGKQAEAKKYINRGLAMPNTEKDDPEVKREGRATLQKIG